MPYPGSHYSSKDFYPHADSYNGGMADNEWNDEFLLHALVEEVTRAGYGHQLLIKPSLKDPRPRWRTLVGKAESLTMHPRNTGGATAGEILAVMLYSGTDAFSEFNADKRRFYDRANSGSPAPAKFKVLDICLMKAKKNIPGLGDEHRHGYNDSGNPLVLWSGMNKAFLSVADKQNRKFTLAQDQSFSRNRKVAEFFMGGQSQNREDQEGTLFEALAQHADHVEIVDHATDCCPPNFLAIGNGFLADISWISKFPDEEETLVEAGVTFAIESIHVLSIKPRVEHVRGFLFACDNWCP
jgi:hypothetical protein